MKSYRYTGQIEQVYPDIVLPGEGVLTAKPGDERQFDQPPADGRWLEIKPPADPVKPAVPASKE